MRNSLGKNGEKAQVAGASPALSDILFSLKMLISFSSSSMNYVNIVRDVMLLREIEEGTKGRWEMKRRRRTMNLIFDILLLQSKREREMRDPHLLSRVPHVHHPRSSTSTALSRTKDNFMYFTLGVKCNKIFSR